jgi:ribosomal protection tetracycline resistance protein
LEVSTRGPDFIAEVERVLGVLDGAVLVISAVESVQAQTRVLMRALQRLSIPTLIFVNKIDRLGAQHQRVLEGISKKLTSAIVPMGSTSDLGTSSADFGPFGADDAAFVSRLADVLADGDDALLAAYLDDETSISYRQLRDRLARQTRDARTHPVFFGSAVTGAGVDCLTAGITELLPAADNDVDGPVSGSVLKVDRGPAGEKIAHVRIFSGTLRLRDRLELGSEAEQKVTAIRVFELGSDWPRTSVTAGQICKLWGLGTVRIGDTMGPSRTTSWDHHFAPPTLETVVVPLCPADKPRLHIALTQLAEQDPLNNVRQDDARNELSVSLYGEVQKEVIQETLATDFAVDVEFRETTTICIERVARTATAVEAMHEEANPFLATVGLRVDPAPASTGIVTLTHTGYAPRQSHSHQRFDKSMSSTGADFRNLTPLVLMEALDQAGTTVYEPVHRFRLEISADTLGSMLPVLARLHALPQRPDLRGSSCLLSGEIPAAWVHELQQRLPGLTGGEGVLECEFESCQPVRGPVPTRPRTDPNPINRDEYLSRIMRPGRSVG